MTEKTDDRVSRQTASGFLGMGFFCVAAAMFVANTDSPEKIPSVEAMDTATYTKECVLEHIEGALNSPEGGMILPQTLTIKEDWSDCVTDKKSARNDYYQSQNKKAMIMLSAIGAVSLAVGAIALVSNRRRKMPTATPS